MKLKGFFHKANELSVTEILEKGNTEKRVSKVGNRTFVTMWEILDASNGYKLIRKGFPTREEAIKYAETMGAKWYLNAYEKEI